MFFLSLLVAKLSNVLICLLNLGSGYTWPGHLALKIYPSFLSSKTFTFPKGIILISGTNGKTTTTKLITHVLESNDFCVLHNRTGANLLNGLASAILLDMDWLGRLQADVGVFEVDEFTLPLVLEEMHPTVLVLLNLSRDQLDRYGEVDTVFTRWKTAVESLDSTTFLVLDADQKRFKEFSEIFKGRISYFNACRDKLGNTSLLGSFNARNLNAAFVVCSILGLDETSFALSLEDFEAAYGRGECIKYKNKLFQLFLAKNPASFNHNLDVINQGNLDMDTLFILLNDNIPDGKDVSWIYDIDPVGLKKACEGMHVFVSGTRSLDMAVRLNYAGVEIHSSNISNDMSVVLNQIIQSNKVQNILVLPNYSSMLQIRKLLVGRKIL